MAARVTSREQKDSWRFASRLSSAFSEWLLIILLFLDATLSYLAARLARFCELQTPCLLCSRLDHFWGNEKPEFYRGLLCETHKLEISSLAYCHVHRNLANFQEMCESCLFSCSKKKNANPEACKMLPGKLREDIDEGYSVHHRLPKTIDGNSMRKKYYGEDMVKFPLLKQDMEPGSSGTKQCSCCSETFKHTYGYRLLQRRLVGGDNAELDTPLAATEGYSRLYNLDDFSNARGNPTHSPPIHHLGNPGFDRLSHVGYSEIKITSDSESEVPFSDDDDANALARGIEELKEEVVDRCIQPMPTTVVPRCLPVAVSDDMVGEKLIHPTPIAPEASPLVIERQLYSGDSCDKAFLESNAAIGHGLGEINWSQVEAKANSPVPYEIITGQFPTKTSNAKLDSSETGDMMQIAASSESGVKGVLSSTDTNSKKSLPLSDSDPSYTRKLAAGNKGTLPAPTSTEAVAGKDSTRVHDDLRLLPSQMSAARGFEYPWNDMSPSPRLSDASSTTGSLGNSKRPSIEANESVLESLYGIASEIEGESALDRLKRQVELDRKSMTILFKELEEERSASAIAANQTMAMITRLQEEKAAMQMEALQYQRMMEEQAEYDQEALENLNDILAEREKEIQDLEAEIDSYRKRFGEGDSAEREYSRTNTPRIMRTGSRQNSYRSLESGRTASRFMKDSLMDMEDEKVYISECLKRLEKKLQLFSADGEDELPPTETIVSGVIHENGNGMLDYDGAKSCKLTGETMEENEVISEKKDSTLSEDNHKERSLCYSASSNNLQYPIMGKTADLIVLGDEVSQLNERLEALEADRDFLDQAINSLKHGADGVQFIREMSCHLRELRKIGIRLRKQMIV